MESFFKTLKVERVYQTRYETRAQARLDIVDWIEGYYNRQRQKGITIANDFTPRPGIAPQSMPKSCSWLHELLYVKTREGHCQAGGYHSIVHQLRRVGRCPVHGGVLEMACHHCGGRAPYRLNAYLLDAPYRCGNCGACYISLLPSQSLWRPLGQKARTAMTRTRLNC